VLKPIAAYFFKAGLPAQTIQREALAEPAFQPLAGFSEDVQKRLHELEEVRPRHRLAAPQRRRGDVRGRWLVAESFALGKQGGECFQVTVVLGNRPALAGGRRRAGEAQANPPMIARRHQNERKQAAWQRLAFRTVLFMNSAAPLFTQENATAVRAAAQLDLPVAPAPP